MARLTYGVDQSQSQSRGTFFLAALIKAFEDAFIVKRMFACIADFEGGRSKGDGYLATFVGMYEGVFQQVGYQHRCQRLAHRYAESGGFGHFYPDVAVGVYLLIIVEVGAEYLVQADFFLVGELVVLYLTQQQERAVHARQRLQRLMGLGKLGELFLGKRVVFHQHFQPVEGDGKGSLHLVGGVSDEKFLLFVHFLAALGEHHRRIVQLTEFRDGGFICQRFVFAAQTVRSSQSSKR